jgi:hypothetical protein
MTADVLAGLHEIPELYLLSSTVLDLGVGRYQISAYGDESLIPDLETRGASVRVLMSTDEIAQFHDRVAQAVQTPEERVAVRPPEPGTPDEPQA